MFEILSAALAKLAALGVAAKATAGLTAAAAAVAAAGATGVLPNLPAEADRGTVEQPVESQVEELLPVEEVVPVEEPVEEVVPVEEPAEEVVPVEEPVEEVVPVEDGDQARQPAPQASFGQSVAEDAREGGVIGSEIAEQARQQGADRRGDAGPPANLPEQSSTGTERAEGAENNSGPGRETADNAPVQDAPAGTPGADRIPTRR